VGQNAERTFTITNTGNRSFTVTAINSSNAAFTIISPTLPVTIEAGSSVTVRVRLTCTTPGAASGTISFVTNSFCGPVDLGTVQVTGFCVRISGDVTPRTIDFGDVCVGQTADRTFTISNTGNRPFTVTAITSSNSAFTIVSPTLPVTIDAGSSVTVTVRLTCTTPGAQSGTISFQTSSACGPVDLGTVNVSGFCVRVSGEVTPRTIDFGDLCVGQSADRTFTISNTGNRPFTVTAITSSNSAFTIVRPALPVTIEAGGSATVTVRLTCTTPGATSGTISFQTSSFCGPVDLGTVSLTGFCVQITWRCRRARSTLAMCA
jgi:hypothetical protein